MLSLLLIFACAGPRAQMSPDSQPGVIQLESPSTKGQVQPKPAEKDQILGVFRQSEVVMAGCFSNALQVNPMLYGELVVGVKLAQEGGVLSSEILFSTIAEEGMQACVLERAAALAFPALSREGIKASYPYLFVTDQTPPEVVRALKVRHGLVPAGPKGEGDLTPDSQPARGEEGWYETW